ncbi:MAG TPA: hypothetical protein VM901_11360 [Bdellovibrionota bacterium]|jgi:hypothetical protein|nr:hypothetical protein [Bdellovibrionota bacterium]
MNHLLVKIPAREHFKVPSKQWAWLDEISAGLLSESAHRGLDVFMDDAKRNPLWVLVPRVGSVAAIVLCSDATVLASDEMKLMLARSTKWTLVGEWRSDEMDYLASTIGTIERWTGNA